MGIDKAKRIQTARLKTLGTLPSTSRLEVYVDTSDSKSAVEEIVNKLRRQRELLGCYCIVGDQGIGKSTVLKTIGHKVRHGLV